MLLWTLYTKKAPLTTPFLDASKKYPRSRRGGRKFFNKMTKRPRLKPGSFGFRSGFQKKGESRILRQISLGRDEPRCHIAGGVLRDLPLNDNLNANAVGAGAQL